MSRRVEYQQVGMAMREFRHHFQPEAPTWVVGEVAESFTDKSYVDALINGVDEQEFIKDLFLNYYIEPAMWCFGLYNTSFGGALRNGLDEVIEEMQRVYRAHTAMNDARLAEVSGRLLRTVFDFTEGGDLVGQPLNARIGRSGEVVPMLIVGDTTAQGVLLTGAFNAMYDAMYEDIEWRTGDQSMYTYNFWSDPKVSLNLKLAKLRGNVHQAFNSRFEKED